MRDRSRKPAEVTAPEVDALAHAKRAQSQALMDRAGIRTPQPEQHVRSVRRQTTGAIGRVLLVGAGPGDPEHLTLKAVRALQSADVILFDDLVSDGVLDLARREAKRMMVGKRGGRASCAQEDINELMVRLARAGKCVVRLKCGDPTIFGRAGEEIARLAEEGIPVEVVPGITTASAFAAGLGVSLTHRDHAQSVRFVTGHARDGKLPAGLDWRGLADPATTLVFYMARGTSGDIVRRLMENGASGATPAVAVVDVSLPTEQRWVGELAQLADGIAALTRTGPVLVGVGRVLSTVLAELADAKTRGAAP